MSADRQIPGADTGLIHKVARNGLATVAGLAALSTMMGACDNGPANNNVPPIPTPNEAQLREKVARLQADKQRDEGTTEAMLIAGTILCVGTMLALGAAAISTERKRRRPIA